MTKKLSKKQKGFADNFLETGNGTQSVLENYNTDDENTAGVMAYDNLRKPKIREYLEIHAGNAITRIEEMSRTATNENVKLSANKDIADRAGYNTVDKSVSLNLNTDIPQNKEAQLLAEEYEEKIKEQM